MKNGRKKPYTAVGIKRVKCIRCKRKAFSQWQVCADGNVYRPLCKPCDIALNRMVLRWMNDDRAAEKMLTYISKLNSEE